jgi:hypothetical protein
MLITCGRPKGGQVSEDLKRIKDNDEESRFMRDEEDVEAHRLRTDSDEEPDVEAHRMGLDRTGLDRTGLDRTGLDRDEDDEEGRDRSSI